MSKHDIKKGDRVTWCDYRSDRVVKGEVLKVFRNGRAQVLSGEDFEKYNIELSRLSVRERQGTLIEVPEVEEKPIAHWEIEEEGLDLGAIERVDELLLPPTSLPPTDLPPTDLPPTSLPPTSLPPTDLPPTDLPPTNLLPGHWIEKKIIHGDIYLYERWREDVEVKGIKKQVKRSRYLEKVTATNERTTK